MTALALAVFLASCATPRPVPDRADLEFPAVGTTWVTRSIDRGGAVTAVTWTVLEDSSYDGKRVHRVGVGGEVRLYDAATRNWVATLRDGEPRWAASPHDGTFAWPLRVGMTWISTVALHDLERRVSSTVVTFWEVEKYEEVEVPAGKFGAFRLHGSPGINNLAYTTLWYAPQLKLVVRRVREGTAGPTATADEFLTELVEYRAP